MIRKALLGLVLLIAFDLSLPTTSFSSGLVTLRGKLVSITETSVIIATKRSEYTVGKKYIDPKLAKTLVHPGIRTQVAVPFQAIERVKSIKKRSSG